MYFHFKKIVNIGDRVKTVLIRDSYDVGVSKNLTADQLNLIQVEINRLDF